MARRKNAREGNVLPDYEHWEFWADPKKGIMLVHLSASRESWSLANPENLDSYMRNSLFAFQFGAYGDTRVLIWEQADHIDSALAAVAEWLEKHAPGHLMAHDAEELKELYAEAKEELGEDATEEEIDQQATADLTYTESGYLTSHEWTVDELTQGDLFKAALYASKALNAASNNTYDLYVKLPLGKGESTESVELEEADVMKLFADEEYGLTSAEVKKISELDENASCDLKAFRIERVR